ncbi:hypothetical protein M413DRAFT_446961 [Hebeloma cylindrosporum]|uniref:Uncharacterized protein n=1 Tax=Hebeloma cylindrosporum TaxID=76867 RepID=A0A0C3C785_HEBCY|nr:hypothetical protein M413DRAFT_446961 [Hebeloma cylindrosporum h7]
MTADETNIRLGRPIPGLDSPLHESMGLERKKWKRLWLRGLDVPMAATGEIVIFKL